MEKSSNLYFNLWEKELPTIFWSWNFSIFVILERGLEPVSSPQKYKKKLWEKFCDIFLSMLAKFHSLIPIDFPDYQKCTFPNDSECFDVHDDVTIFR